MDIERGDIVAPTAVVFKKHGGAEYRSVFIFKRKGSTLAAFLLVVGQRINFVIAHDIPLLYPLFVHPLHTFENKVKHLRGFFGRQFYKFAFFHLFTV